MLGVKPEMVRNLTQIPYLPIQFFKSHTVTSTIFEPIIVFESSGTTQSIPSRHYIKDIELYRESFGRTFRRYYGKPEDLCILGLLPSYLERKNSSLVLMVEELIYQSNNYLSGLYLHDHNRLHQTILHNEIRKQPTILVGVTYALLDFAEKFPMRLKYTIVMETGGMKGRREEITTAEVHAILKQQLGVSVIHSEYGMTELLSQAYSKSHGRYNCPPWMKVLIRDEDDPFLVQDAPPSNRVNIQGLINIVDLANVYSCSFIATDDIGKLHHNGSFEVLGRADNSDIRGCSLLTIG